MSIGFWQRDGGLPLGVNLRGHICAHSSVDMASVLMYSAGVCTPVFDWHLYSCTWHGICTPVLDRHLYSSAWLAFVLLNSTWLHVLVYSTESCSHVLEWNIICTRSKLRRSFWFVPWGQNFLAWQNKLWSVGLIAHNQIDEYTGAHYSAFIRILAAFYETVHYSELHWFAMLSDSMAGKTNMPLMGTAGHLLHHQQHHQSDIRLESKTEYLYIIQNWRAPPPSEKNEQVRF